MIKSIVFFICFYLISYLAGSWGVIALAKCRAGASYVFRTAFGGCTVIAAGMAACLAGSVFRLPVASVAGIFLFIIAIVVISGYVLEKKHAVKEDAPHIPPESTDAVMILAAVLVVGAQIYGVITLRYEGTEVLRGVRDATAVYETGKVMPHDPMMLLIGCISALVHTHPLELIYTVLPPSLIVLYYLCYLEVISTLWCGWKRVAAFLAVTALNLWGYQSEPLTGATLLLSWFGIWVYVLHGLCNILAVIMIRYLKALPDKAEAVQEENEDLLEEWDMKKHRIINARNLAIALGVLTAALIGVVFVLNSKINRLYDATVNLQDDLNSRCSIYEFIPAGGETEGYLLRGSDGTLTFIGGGAAENADELETFIGRFGSEVERWYVYSDDEEGAGAMRALTSKGAVSAGKVYVMNREEISEQQ